MQEENTEETKINLEEETNPENVDQSKELLPGKKRRRLGRAARRRRAKIRSLKEMEHLLLSNDSSCSSTPTATPNINATKENVYPNDRGRALPGVLARRMEYGTLSLFTEHDAVLPQGEENEGRSTSASGGGGVDADRVRLKCQLGFLPGNGIAIASRDEGQCVSNAAAAGDDINTAHPSNEAAGTPLVLKLYPLAVRDVYAGGKADGRKFKSRQRGNNGTREEEDTTTVCSSNDATKNGEIGGGTEKGIVSEDGGDIIQENSNGKVENQSNGNKKQKRRRDWRTQDEKGVIEPFPTIFWLTCPKLRAMISNLENGNVCNVKMMEDRLRNDTEALESMKEAHRRYGQERWKLLTDEDREEVNKRGWSASLGEGRGVAGIRKPETIKCLHTHTAHYLSGETTNIVGKWAIEALKKGLR